MASEAQIAANPKDLAALNALIQVYSRWERWDDALADSLAAMNLYLDEPKERRRAATASIDFCDIGIHPMTSSFNT